MTFIDFDWLLTWPALFVRITDFGTFDFTWLDHCWKTNKRTIFAFWNDTELNRLDEIISDKLCCIHVSKNGWRYYNLYQCLVKNDSQNWGTQTGLKWNKGKLDFDII